MSLNNLYIILLSWNYLSRSLIEISRAWERVLVQRAWMWVGCFPKITKLRVYIGTIYLDQVITEQFLRKTYCHCRGRIETQGWRGAPCLRAPPAGVRTGRQLCRRLAGQSESRTDHTVWLRSGYSEGSSVCPRRACSSLTSASVSWCVNKDTLKYSQKKDKEWSSETIQLFLHWDRSSSCCHSSILQN